MPILKCYPSLRIPLLILFLFSPGLLFSQIKITGSVSDDKGRSLPGVSVSVKEKGLTTQTDSTGRFTVNADMGNTLVFSSVGHETFEAKVGNRSEYRIVLKSKAYNFELFRAL